MNTTILLGAGSSTATGFPSTQCLTNRVLSGHGVKRHTDSSYYICGTGPPTEEPLLANCMARRLHAQAERYYSIYAERRANYEDIFYLASQVADDQASEMENPAVLSFLHELRADMSLLIEAASDSYCHKIRSFSSLSQETRNYIADIVWCYLSQNPLAGSRRQLDLLAHACNCVKITSISTLCHDTHVETFLAAKNIPLSDGFSEPERGVRYWNGDFPSNESIPFLKLHGSVNWFSFSPHSGDPHASRIGIPLEGDHYHTQTDNDGQQLPSPRPLLLIGTFNKIAAYSSGIFGELHHRFRTTIREANQMVICGYGFGDKGINMEILEWYYQKPGRRLLVIHPDPVGLLANARPAIQRVWPTWEDNGSISIIDKRFECVDIDEFVTVIASSPCATADR